MKEENQAEPYRFIILNKVRQYRKQYGQSQEQVALAVGTSRQTINKIENGKCIPELPLAFSLCFHFNKPLNEIFFAADCTPCNTVHEIH